MAGFGQAFDTKGANQGVTTVSRRIRSYHVNSKLPEKSLLASAPQNELMHAFQWAYSVAGFSLPV